MPKLTYAEKLVKGTLQKSRIVAPRTVEKVREEIADTEQALDDMRCVLGLALTQIRKHGLMVKVKVLDSHGKSVKTDKVNPAIKIHKDALSSVKSLKRYLTLLREEEAIASAKQNDANEFAEFE